ncbi:MAG: alpha-L-fucosidase [Bacteroidetes bacterium]|nr:alpha-L-fucosidase [Bacteroidota bacterium]
MKNQVNLFLLAFLLLVCSNANAQTFEEDMSLGWEERTRKIESLEAHLADWEDRAIGIFIHWSPSTAFQGRYKGQEIEKDLWGEWTMYRAQIPVPDYENTMRDWNPGDFNAGEWADVIEKAGFRYLVYVAKHHDGFAMFDANADNYSISRWGIYHGDPFKKLCNQLQKRNISTGFYYSHGADWRNKFLFEGSAEEVDNQYFEKIVKPHLEQLNTEYGLQSVAWFDGGWRNRPDLSKACEDVLRKDHPSILISSRIGHGIGNFKSHRDCFVPPVSEKEPWETCMTLNHHWAWTPADKGHKSATEVIQMLAKVRSRGGNLLLNIGPDVRGKIPFRDQLILEELGQWLKVNGESVYGAESTPYSDLPWGVCTQKPGKLYLHIMSMPSSDFIFLPGLKSQVSRAYFLSDKEKRALDFTRTEGGYKIALLSSITDSFRYDRSNTVLVVEYEGKQDISTIPVLDHDFDNHFIPQLAEKENGCITQLQRIAATADHPALQEPRWEEFAQGFSQEGARLKWNYHLFDLNRFVINIEYANLTGEDIQGIVQVGGKTHPVRLPSTLSSTHPFEVFTLITTGSLELEPGEMQELSFQIKPGQNIESLDENVPTSDERVRNLRRFMLKSVILKPFFPLPYEGYSHGKEINLDI